MVAARAERRRWAATKKDSRLASPPGTPSEISVDLFAGRSKENRRHGQTKVMDFGKLESIDFGNLFTGDTPGSE